MRAFVRIDATEVVLTLDLPSRATVLALKQAVFESGQMHSYKAAGAADVRLVLHATELPDDTTLESCLEPTSQSPNALHVMLQMRDSQAYQLESASPAPGASNVPLDTEVHVILPNISDASGCSMELRGWMDQSICGDTYFDASARELRFRPQGVLLPGRVYCAIVRAKLPPMDFVWQFSTAPLPAVRIILERRKRGAQR